MTSEANEPLLSAEETNALLDAMRQGGAAAAQVETVDIASSERPLRGALGPADGCARTIATAVDKLMLRVTGTATVTEELPAEIVPYKVFRASIPEGAAVLACKGRDGGGVMLTVGPLLVSFILDRRMGAPVAADKPPSPRPTLSALDRRLLEPAAHALVELVGRRVFEDPAWLSKSAVLTHGADLAPLAQFEPLLQLVFRVVPSGLSGDSITVAMTASAAGSAAALHPRAQSALAVSPGARAALAASVGRVEVDAVAVFGHARVTLRELLAFEAGDLVRLDTIPDEPLPVRVGSKCVLRGMPIVRHGNLAVHISTLGEGRP